VWIVFAVRVAIGWHSQPAGWLRLSWHGKYCGPGHSGTGPPVDELDAACRDHDIAYD
jgi:hypothetical protein